MDGHINEGEINVPVAGFRVEKGIETIEPFESYFRADWRVDAPVIGTFADSGKLELRVGLIQTVEFRGVACEVGPVDTVLTTEGSSSVGFGKRFTVGLDGPGAVVATWNSVPFPQGATCNVPALTCLPRQSLLKGPGAFGVARGGIELRGAAPPEGPMLDKFGIVDYEDEGGCLGKRPDSGPGGSGDPDPNLDANLAVELRRLTVGRKKVKFRIKVVNTGGDAAGVTVCARAIRGPRLRKPGCESIGSVTAGTSFSRRLTVVLPANRARRNRQLRRGSVKVSITADGHAERSVTRRIYAARPKK